MPKSRMRSAAALSLVVLGGFLCIIQFLLLVLWFGLDDLVFLALGLALYYDAFLRHKSNQIKLICVVFQTKRLKNATFRPLFLGPRAPPEGPQRGLRRAAA